jgi:hypothetical protein
MLPHAAMGNQLFLLLVGFVLTTAGAGVAWWLQERSWQQQEGVPLVEAEREAARAFFEDVSRMLDRRVHRMRQLDKWLGRPGEAEEVERLLARYREVVDEWNENWNRILSLARSYFGEDLRVYLDYKLGRRFVDVGRQLEVRARVQDWRRGYVAGSRGANRVSWG